MYHWLILFAWLATASVAACQDKSVPVNAKALPLMQAVYQAARACNTHRAVEYLAQAGQCIEQKTDVNAKDSNGRTALHWAVLGAMYAEHEKLRQNYIELAEQLIEHGAKTDCEDDYGKTPLNYQQFSPNLQFGRALIENIDGHESGYTAASSTNLLLNQLRLAAALGDLNTVRSLLRDNLPDGAEIQMRLLSKVASNFSRAGDSVAAVVIAPVVVENRILITPGAKIYGTVMFSAPATNHTHQAELVLDFANLVLRDGSMTRLATQVIAVDNAKESVQAGRIIGVSTRHSSLSKLSWGLLVMEKTTPLISGVMEAATFGYGKTRHREIVYEPGVEMTLRVTAPVKLDETAEAHTPLDLPASKALADLVKAQPLRVNTPSGIPSDLTNVMLVGGREKLVAAFQAAGWEEGNALSLKSGLATFVAVAESKGCKEEPVSVLQIDGRKADLIYQKQNDTIAKRHHIRIWQRADTYLGKTIWLGAATHDVAIAVHRKGPHWTHRLDPRIDLEREKIANDLMMTGMVKGCARVERPAAPQKATIATGEEIETDGKVLVLIFE